MTPGARLQAAIELIDAILPKDRAAIPPADKTIQTYVRARRFMGSKDRAWVTGTVYGVLRSFARIDWHLDRAGADPIARMRLFAYVMLVEGWSPEAIQEACAAGGYAAAPPTDTEDRSLRLLALVRDAPPEEPSPLGGEGRVRGEHRPLQTSAGQLHPPHPATATPGSSPGQASATLSPRIGGEGNSRLSRSEQPDWVRGEYPEWLGDTLSAAFGGREALLSEMVAAGQPSIITLRVNRLKADVHEAVVSLAEDDIAATSNPLLTNALDVPARSRIEASRAWRSGMIEIQDAAAQMAVRLVDARPDMTVCDFCAGAGGKTLALAADMEGSGRIVACDIGAGRMKPLAKRSERAGCAEIIDGRVLGRDSDPETGAFDRVLVDAPCSGSGTWRRNPEAKWRLTGDELNRLTAVQDEILDRAVTLVRPGGRLVYATCSVLPAENAERVEVFLERHSDFNQIDARDVWRERESREPPFVGPAMFLTPARHGTDGFFTAIFERVR